MSSSIDSQDELFSTRFRKALSASGLVDGLVLHRIATEVISEQPDSKDAQDLAFVKRLIDQDRLNRWQVEQLQQGRTKFTLGSYRILDSIGSGGMGHVFKGEHELLGRIEAVKVLPRNKMTPEAIASFRHEIRAQAKLDHPNLVRVSYADRDGDTYFFVTEFVEGIDLRRLIRRRGALPEAVSALVVSQAAEAIDYAHRRGLVHRDVKPGNLLLTLDGRVKVTDLGLAWFLDEGETIGTPVDGKKVVGTSDYIAPEAIQDPGRIIPVSDVYSLGCTLYYAVTGKVPYPGGSHAEKLRRQVSQPTPNPSLLNPNLSNEMVQLILQMLEKDPNKRTPSAAAVQKALEELVTQEAKAELVDLVTTTTSEITLKNNRQLDDLDQSTGISSKEPSPEPLLAETVGLSNNIPITSLPTPGIPHEDPLVEKEVSETINVVIKKSKLSLDYYLKLVTILASILTVGILLAAIWRSIF